MVQLDQIRSDRDGSYVIYSFCRASTCTALVTLASLLPTVVTYSKGSTVRAEDKHHIRPLGARLVAPVSKSELPNRSYVCIHVTTSKFSLASSRCCWTPPTSMTVLPWHPLSLVPPWGIDFGTHIIRIAKLKLSVPTRAEVPSFLVRMRKLYQCGAIHMI